MSVGPWAFYKSNCCWFTCLLCLYADDSHLYFNNLMIDFYPQPRRNNRKLSSLVLNNKKHKRNDSVFWHWTIIVVPHCDPQEKGNHQVEVTIVSAKFLETEKRSLHRIQWPRWDERTKVRAQRGQGGWTLRRRIQLIHPKCLRWQWCNFLFSDYGGRGTVFCVVLFHETQMADRN